MGGVYLARHQELGNIYALKETFFAQDGKYLEYLEAFKREAQLLANLNHPNLPKVRDYFSEAVEHLMPDGSKSREPGHFLVMDYIEGKDLAEFLERRKQNTPPQGMPKPFELESVLDWADQLLDILEYLHSQKPPVIHRDIKPPNLKLTPHGQLFLIDFGIAKGAVADMTQIVAGRTILAGSLPYSPIEQLLRISDSKNDKPVAPFLSKEELNEIQQQYTDARADLYAVGATLYELLTGNRPTPSVDRLIQLQQGRPDPLRRLHEVNPAVPPKVAEAVAWAMEIKRDDRPISATQLRQALRAANPGAQAVEVKPVVCEPGAILQNRYLILRHLGAGGMGSVYEARAQNLRGKSVALKRINFENTDPEYHARLIQMFEREADLLIRLKHPALPTVYDFFSEGADYFLVMEYIAGDDLAVLLQRVGSPFALDKVLPWADQLLGILEYLHEQKPPILHRDIKPHNLKLNKNGEIILLDFGLAKSASGANSQSGKSSSLGTPGYAPPEQYINSDVSSEPDIDARVDVYSVGATLYHLLTGKVPVDVTSRMGKLFFQQPDPLRLASELNPQVPSAIAEIIRKAMELNREYRYASVREMKQQLREASEVEKRAEEQRKQEAERQRQEELRLQQQELIRLREEIARREREDAKRKRQEEAQRQGAERQAEEQRSREEAERLRKQEEDRKAEAAAEKRILEIEEEERREKIMRLAKDGGLQFGSKNYSVAIQKWEEALRLSPNEPALKEYIAIAKREVEKESQPQQAKAERKRQEEEAEKLKQQQRLSTTTDTFQFETPILDARGIVLKRRKGKARYFSEDLGNGVKLDMVAIPGGTFMMGSPDNEEYNTPQY